MSISQPPVHDNANSFFYINNEAPSTVMPGAFHDKGGASAIEAPPWVMGLAVCYLTTTLAVVLATRTM